MQTGLKPVFTQQDAEKINKSLSVQASVTADFGKNSAKFVGDVAGKKQKELTDAAAAADKAGNKAEADRLTAEASLWSEGGAYRVSMHLVAGAMGGGINGAAGAAASAASAGVLNKVQDQMQASLVAGGMNADVAKATASLLTAGASAAIAGAAGGVQGATAGLNVDLNNRQLHPSETKRIKELADKKAKETCQGNSDCERSANLYWTDMLQSAAEGRVDNDKAKQNNAYYNQVINAAGIVGSEAAVTGASSAYFNDLKSAQLMLNAEAGKPIIMTNGQVQLGSDGKPQTYFSATDAQKADAYGNVFPGGSPGTTISGVPGKAQRDQDRLDRLRTPNGSVLPDTTLEEALIGMRMPARAGGSVVRVTAAGERAAIPGTARSAEEALLASGGMLDRAGQPLLDMKSLSSAQKERVGDLFGADTVKQIVPDGQKIARVQGTGTTGIDDLYKVNRPDVDYVAIEYKFVGQDGKTGAQVLSVPADGRQGSTSWIKGAERIPRAVGDEAAISVENSIKSGRFESWVVTTRPDGSTLVQVLDAAGRPKPIDTSKIILPPRSLSGAQP